MSARRKPEPLSSLVAEVLAETGIAGRVEQAGVLADWATHVGAQIAAVTEPLSITPDGTLFVAVRTNAWMNELSLLEPELLSRLNTHAGERKITRLRMLLMRSD